MLHLKVITAKFNVLYLIVSLLHMMTSFQLTLKHIIGHFSSTSVLVFAAPLPLNKNIKEDIYLAENQ